MLSKDVCVIYGSVALQKLSADKCNLFITAKIDSRADDLASSDYYMFDRNKILALAGINGIDFSSYQTILNLDQTHLTSGIVSAQPKGYGLHVSHIPSQNSIGLGRIYTTDGAMGLYAGNSNYYTPGTIYTISIYGATYN